MTNPEPLTWGDMIGYIGKQRMEIAQLNGDVFPLTYPGVKANSEELDAAEHRLGHPLDNQLRELLGQINGWPRLIYSTHLMPAEDLGQGDVWDAANEGLDILYEDVDPEDTTLPPRDELMPFVISDRTTNIYVIWTKGPLTDGGHPVIWLAGEEMERYDNVRDFFFDVVRRTKTFVENERREATAS